MAGRRCLYGMHKVGDARDWVDKYGVDATTLITSLDRDDDDDGKSLLVLPQCSQNRIETDTSWIQCMDGCQSTCPAEWQE